MHVEKRIAATVAAAAAAIIFTIAPGAAAAAKSTYHPSREARTFHSSDGGWKGRVTQDGTLCVVPVTCPTVTTAFAAADGAGGAGDGHLEVGVSGLTTVLTTSRADYASPRFKYRGVRGHRPKRVNFKGQRRSDLADLLSIPDASASQTVKLVDLTRRGRTLTLVDHRALSGDGSWTNMRRVHVKPRKLKIGHRYRIRLTAKFTTPIAVLPSSTVGYDNVVLTARGVRRHH